MRTVHGLAIGVMLCVGVASAQQPPVPRPAVPAGQPQPLQPLQQQPGAAAGQALSAADQQLAACIYMACRNEIEIAKFSQSKIQSEEVRAFAEKMIREHTADCETYQRLAGSFAPAHEGDLDPAAGAPGAAPRPAAAPPAVGVEVSPRTGAVPPAGVAVNVGGRNAFAAGHIDWPALHREMADQCLASSKQELGRHQGAEFDHCFMGQQFGAHMQVSVELKVLRNHASPQLAAQIDKSNQVVQAHLQEARQIMERLKDSPPARVTRKPDGDK